MYVYTTLCDNYIKILSEKKVSPGFFDSVKNINLYPLVTNSVYEVQIWPKKKTSVVSIMKEGARVGGDLIS